MTTTAPCSSILTRSLAALLASALLLGATPVVTEAVADPEKPKKTRVKSNEDSSYDGDGRRN